MRGKLLVALLAVVLSVVFSLVISSNDRGTARADEDGSYVGEVVGQGTRDGDLCVFTSPVSLTVAFTDGQPGKHVRAHIGDDCSVVVTAVTPASESGDPGNNEIPPSSFDESEDLPDAARHEHEGHAKVWVEEFINIDVTRTEVLMDYWHDGNWIGDGNNARYLNWNDGVGWTHTGLVLNWFPTGPSHVFIYHKDRWQSWVPPTPDYTISAKFEVHNYTQIHGHCVLHAGKIPVGWDMLCHGAHHR